MSWRDSMTPASFRGVEFEVANDELQGGRDGMSHLAPGSEASPYVEDTGRKGRSFFVDAFLVGDDCLAARNALLTALELKGSGDLVHPTYGARRVSVDSFTSRYSSREGGLVSFSITFRETSADPVMVLDVISPEGVVAEAAEALGAVSLADFFARYVTIPFSAALQSVVVALADQAQVVADAKALVDEDAAALHAQVEGMRAQVDALLGAPADLADAVRALVTALGAGAERATAGVAAWTALLSLYDLPLGDRPADGTPAGMLEAQSWDATDALVKREVIAAASSAVTSAKHEAHEDAVGARAEVLDKIDSYCEAYEDDTYEAMTGLRRALCQAVPAPAEQLPRLEQVQLPRTLPSLVLAYTLYRDLAKEEMILRRNGVEDPTYLPGGVPLEVLTP